MQKRSACEYEGEESYSLLVSVGVGGEGLGLLHDDLDFAITLDDLVQVLYHRIFQPTQLPKQLISLVTRYIGVAIVEALQKRVRKISSKKEARLTIVSLILSVKVESWYALAFSISLGL